MLSMMGLLLTSGAAVATASFAMPDALFDVELTNGTVFAAALRVNSLAHSATNHGYLKKISSGAFGSSSAPAALQQRATPRPSMSMPRGSSCFR